MCNMFLFEKKYICVFPMNKLILLFKKTVLVIFVYNDIRFPLNITYRVSEIYAVYQYIYSVARFYAFLINIWYYN